MQPTSLGAIRPRVVIRRRSARYIDVSALTALIVGKARGAGVSLLSRELLLDISEEAYEPSVAAHIPGIANKLADALSRTTAPAGHGAKESVESLLKDSNAFKVTVPDRTLTFLRTKTPPQ